jgi:general secretion pathway protein H
VITVRSRATQRGLTLIEILIVLAVMGLMVAMVVVGFGTGRAAEISRATTQVANTVRYGFDKARVNGGYYRLLLNLDNAEFSLQAAEDAMYLPATDRDGEIKEIDQRDLEEQQQRDERAEQSFNRSVQSAAYRGGGTGGAAGDDGGGDTDGGFDAYKPAPRKVPRARPPLFASFETENELSTIQPKDGATGTGLASELSKFSKPFKLPEGVKIVYVRTADDLEPITKGEASIYFFPRGRTQKAHIQIASEDGQHEYTIKIEPLTGRVTVVDGLEPLVLPDDPNDEEDDLGREFHRRTF